MGRFILVFLVLSKSLFGRPIYFEAYGDSLTSGFMSQAALVSPPPLQAISRILSDMAMYFVTKDPSHISKYHEPTFAWPSVLAELSGIEEWELQNLAVTGAKTRDLASQVEKASHPLSMAFFFIGHNDLCKSTESEDELAERFHREFEKAIEYWEAHHDKSLAFFVPVGEIHRVYETLEGYVWHDGEIRYRCDDSWQNLFPYCRRYYRLLKEGKLRDYLAPRIQRMNLELQGMAQSFSQSKRNSYYFLPAVHATDYQLSDFAIDCFHLSRSGQKRLAEAVLKNLPE